MEEHSYVCSPRPFRPKSPQSPHSPQSPKGRKVQPSGDENSAPRSPKVTLSEPKSPKPSGAKGASSGSKTSEKIKTYFNQSDLIRPVSVKLENCLLAPENKGLIEGANVARKSLVNLTSFELQGLNMVVNWLENLAPTKKNVPKDITDPEALLRDAKVN